MTIFHLLINRTCWDIHREFPFVIECSRLLFINFAPNIDDTPATDPANNPSAIAAIGNENCVAANED